MYDVFDICRYFINECNDKGFIISEIKLQDLLFLAKGYSYVFDRKELFEEHFEKWSYQPVIPEVWQRYKPWLGMNIPKERTYEDVVLNKDNELERITRCFNKYGIDKDTRDTLNAIINNFAKLSSTDLNNIVCQSIPYVTTEDKKEINEKSIMIYFIEQINK